MALSPKEMGDAIIRNLPDKTGRTFAQWVKIARKRGSEEAAAKRDWLKREYGLGHVTATLIAGAASGKGNPYSEPDQLVDRLFPNPRAHRLYEEIVRNARTLGKDVRVIPCKTYVGLSRKKQFAVIQPKAPDHVDLGLSLGSEPPSDRLVTARSIGAERITRRVSLTSVRDIDAELKSWLQEAYVRAS